MKFVLLSLLACVFALSACTDRDPVSSKQPETDTEVAAKRISSARTASAPVAGTVESGKGMEDGMEDGEEDGMEDDGGTDDGGTDDGGTDDGGTDDGGTDDSSGS